MSPESSVRDTDRHTHNALEVPSGHRHTHAQYTDVHRQHTDAHRPNPGSSIRGMSITRLSPGSEVRVTNTHTHIPGNSVRGKYVNILPEDIIKGGSVCRDGTKPSRCKAPHSLKPYIRASYSGIKLVT